MNIYLSTYSMSENECNKKRLFVRICELITIHSSQNLLVNDWWALMTEHMWAIQVGITPWLIVSTQVSVYILDHLVKK